ncbi:MAG: transporter substrate-binding domain-containing protein [Verrucomicrobia bacterium]|nr:transporter substrate-binding domain-containing protein [Verrucomicrobiota bacterium]
MNHAKPQKSRNPAQVGHVSPSAPGDVDVVGQRGALRRTRPALVASLHAERIASLFALFLRAAVSLVLVVFVGAAFAAADSPEIRVGSELDFRPYAFTDRDGQATGFSVDLIKAVANAMGLRVRITTGPWDQVWEGLAAGKFDVLPTVARVPGRERFVDFSLPHTETYDAFFVRPGQSAIPNLAAATGKEIVVLRSDAAHHELVQRKFAGKLILADSIPDGLRLVASGRHDAFLCSKLVGVLELQQTGIKGIKPGPPVPDYKRVFSFAVRKGNAELLEKLNQGLLIIKASGEYNQLYRRWLGVEEPWQQWRRYLWVTLAIAGPLTGLALALVMILRQMVRRRTRELEAEVAERRRAEAALQQLNATLEQRVAERTAAVRASEARLHRFYESGLLGVIYWNTKGAITDANGKFLAMVGYSREDLAAGRIDWVRMTPPEYRHLDEASAKELNATGVNRVPFEKEYIRKDGSRIPVLIAGAMLDEARVNGVAFVLDITERKRAQEALRRASERDAFLVALTDALRPLTEVGEIKATAARVLGLHLRASRVAYAEVTPEGDVFLERGYADGVADIPGRYRLDDYGPALLREIRAGRNIVISDVANDPGYTEQEKARYEAVQVVGNLNVPLLKDGRPVALLAVHQKVSRQWSDAEVSLVEETAERTWATVERARAEAALRENRERLDLALASSGMATFDWDIVHNKRTWSQGVHNLLGTKAEGFSGSAEEFFQVIHPEDVSKVRAALARAVEATGLYEMDYRAVWPDGSIRHIAARGKVHRDHTGQAVVMTGVCWNITARMQAENEIRRRAEELRAANEELTRFNRVTVGRELRIIELKKQVNELCARLHQPPRYGIEPDEDSRPKQ